jgi:hypothetical protein
MNKEVNVVKPALEEGQSPVEVGFDIYGTEPKPEIPIDQGKPRMHLNLIEFIKLISLMLMKCCIK